ncbi:hypothetical protein [Deinococcus soli (ex Cha et al. 2016)]|uniref:Uncharacterized protein n=2 Tax=Deinococcus soli (ex Cha et al. 2016) TaxID=1309411 RepID=A0ACC6KL00_9DEIO|nr:hypothetical protein [Deinococcus soli (ex Cha et al. 2016)]MDR6218708.1 hypothetical protein [Deinococcus soli (ex Cha et al. 2016)]MDR6328505.1 hypothetical protein [Deinococcus soli (ex Cha et al. 2016)]MDR6753116.1 hypothetical protein [Deinococcus soli (ex Cha et al. 2016)]
MNLDQLEPLLRRLNVTFDAAARHFTRADGTVIPVLDESGVTLDLNGQPCVLIPGGPSSPELPTPADTITLAGLNALSTGSALEDLGLHVTDELLQTPGTAIPARHLDGPAHAVYVRLDGRWFPFRRGPHLALSTLLGVLEPPEHWTVHEDAPLFVASTDREVLVGGAVLNHDDARALGRLLHTL